MLKRLVTIVRNALALVVLVAIVVWVVKNRIGRPEPSSTSTVEPGHMILERLEHVNKQIFIEHFNAVDVHYSEAPAPWLEVLVKQEFVVLIRGKVPAGFDLQQLKRDNIWISQDGSRVQLTLPPPQVFEDNVSIDFARSSILYRRDTCPWFLCRDSLAAYQNVILPEGKTYLIEYALQNGILEQAARDGKAYYEEFLRAMGFKEVRVVVTGYDL